MAARKGVRSLGYKDPRGFEYVVVDVDLLIPDPENPRIPIQESTLDTLKALLLEDADSLFSLAKDLVEMRGMSPSELLSVTPLGSSFVVKEGNRRVAAQRILRNPEQLRGVVSNAELDRWTRLAADPAAATLPSTALVVVSGDHEDWIDRRHLGPQGGIGVQQWRPQAKARREQQRKGTKDRTLSLLEGLKTVDPETFGDLEPPPRTFTTFERILDSSAAVAHIGVDVDEDGNVQLTKGERSVRFLEEVLRDLRKPRETRLTSRKIHDKEAILSYLDELDQRIEPNLDERPISLNSQKRADASSKQQGRASARRVADVLKTFVKPSAARPQKILEELKKARRHEMPNAALILVRVLLELSADHYASRVDMAFAGDKNPSVDLEVQEFQKQLSLAGIQTTKAIRDALRFAASRPLSLGAKLELVIRDLMTTKKLPTREAQAKIRELREKEVLELLNDAVHRLETVPSPARADHILEVIRPVYNAMESV